MFVRRDTERRLRVGADSRGGNRRSWLARTPLQSERLPAIRGRFIQREPRACVLWRRWISSKGKGNRLDVVPLSNDRELASLDWLSGDGADRSACGAAKCHLGGVSCPWRRERILSEDLYIEKWLFSLLALRRRKRHELDDTVKNVAHVEVRWTRKYRWEWVWCGVFK